MNLLIVRLLCVVLLCLVLPLPAAETFRVATYNLNNYMDEAVGTRPAKTVEAKAKIRESIRALKADVIALQEMGGARPFAELRQSLKAAGLDYPHSELLLGWDTNIHVAVLSKFPIVGRRLHAKDSFLLMGKRFTVSRGFLEVDLQVNPSYQFTLITTHLKSRRQITQADEAEMRLEEARLLREKIDARLAAKPEANLVVLGDFNDTKDTQPIRTVIGRYRNALIDTRPAERNGDNCLPANPRWDPAWITWTHFYGKEDTYSRIDYILLSSGMAREWVKGGTYVLALTNWSLGSDHRPIVAEFTAGDR